MAATGLEFKELSKRGAVELGCLSALQRLQQRGHLLHAESLCEAAARSGQLEELKALRENDTPWDEFTCAYAAMGGHLEVLQWARTNNCAWDTRTCSMTARAGHLEVFSGRARTGVRGMQTRASGRRSADTSIF